VHDKSTVFSAPIFTKRVAAQQHYVQTSFTEFQQNRAKKVENADENSFTPLRKYGFHWADFHATKNHNFLLLWLSPVSNYKYDGKRRKFR